MNKRDFEAKLERIKAQEKKYGVTINITDLIDKDHLDCLWYGGQVGSIKYEDYLIVIGAYGDVRLHGRINGEEVDVVDKYCTGGAYRELGSRLTDDDLNELLYSEDEDNYLEYENNNWFEVDLISPDGEWVDLCDNFNVLDGDLLDCFCDVQIYFDYVHWSREEYYKRAAFDLAVYA